jgi:hypothetical protein
MTRFRKIRGVIRYYFSPPPVFSAREQTFVTVSNRRVILAIILGFIAGAVLV